MEMAMSRTEQIKVGRGYNPALIRAESFNEEDNTVEVIWSTGAGVRRRSYEHGEYMEELSMKPADIRLDRMNSGAPVLDSHDSWDLSRVIGTVVPGTAKIVKGSGVCSIRLSGRDEVKGVVQDIRDGIISSISVGYRIHKYEKEEGEGDQIPILRATDWEPLEISAVAIPADPAAKIRSSDQSEMFDCIVVRHDDQPAVPSATNKEVRTMTDKLKAVKEAAGEKLEGMARFYDLVRKDGESDEDLRKRLTSTIEAETKSADDKRKEDEAAATAAAEASRKADDDAAKKRADDDAAKNNRSDGQQRSTGVDETRAREIANEAASEARTAERKRTSEIRSLGNRLGMKEDLIRKHELDGTSVEAFRDLALEAVAERQSHSETFEHAPFEIVRDEVDTRRSMIVNALSHRLDPRTVTLEEGAREWRGLPLLEIVRECERRNGNSTRGMSRTDLASRAFHSTSDFPIIMEQVTNRVLLQGYQALPQTFQPFCRQSSASDFRDMHRVQVGEVGDLKKVNEHGEYTRTTLSEGKEKYRIATYGRIIGVTRQLLINDDLGVIGSLGQKFGASVARLESKTVWDLITSNVVMGDGNALFSAAHNNLAAGAAIAALSTASINAGRVIMGKQKDLDERDLIDVSPSFLLYPPELSMEVAQIFGQIQATKEADVRPSWVQSLTPIEESKLSAESATAFYLVAAPSLIDTIEYAYLEGNEAPYTETRVGFDVDGMEIKVRHDFGAAPIDFRGFYKQPGA